MCTGLLLGALVGTVATFITAGTLASGVLTPNSHRIDGDLSDPCGLPIVGWSTTDGDLLVAHFLCNHLLRAPPIHGWLADRVLPGWHRSRSGPTPPLASPWFGSRSTKRSPHGFSWR
ncbi:MAG: hypothetical protein AAGI03_08425 [Pseudomonadota bacterium]